MNRLRNTIAIAFAILLIVGVDARSAVARSDAVGGGAVAKYDGQTIFSAVFFAKGPAASALPTRAFPAPTEDQAQTILGAIQAADPSFFDRFAADIRSGDRALIREALNGAARALHDAVVVARSHTLTDCDPSLDPSCTTCDPTIDVCDEAIKLLIAVHAVIAIVAVDAADFYRVVDFVQDYNVYYSSDLWRTQYWYQAVTGETETQLAEDAFIDAIAKAFAA